MDSKTLNGDDLEFLRLTFAAAQRTEPMTTAACDAPGYRVETWMYVGGQLRLQLYYGDEPCPRRELCTYNSATKHQIEAQIAAAADPEAFCESLVRPWNFEYPGGRIRLDNRLEDRPEMVGRFNEDGTPR